MKINYITGRDRVDAFDRDYPFKLIRANVDLKLNRETFERYNKKFKIQVFLDEFKRQNPNISTGSVILTNFVFVLVIDDDVRDDQIRECVNQLKEVIVELNGNLGNHYQINSIGLDKSLLGFTENEFARFLEILHNELKDIECEFVVLLDE